MDRLAISFGCPEIQVLMEETQAEKILKAHGFRSTKARRGVLQVLSKHKKPIGIESIGAELDGVNPVTLYRIMEAFQEAGVVRSCDLGHGHADYELAAGRPHHHHVVCRECGVVEDIDLCGDEKAFNQKALKQTKKFKGINLHTMTFFGSCKACVKA